jgi:hypothetical protein
VKQIIFSIIAGLVVAGCCSTRNDIQYSSTSDLQLRRYELKHCLSMARTSWDKQPVQSNAYHDVEKTSKKSKLSREKLPSAALRIIAGHHQARIDLYMILVTANVGLLPCKNEKKSYSPGKRSVFYSARLF